MDIVVIGSGIAGLTELQASASSRGGVWGDGRGAREPRWTGGGVRGGGRPDRERLVGSGVVLRVATQDLQGIRQGA